MADIEDEKEFEGFLAGMIQHWRNVRQRKRVRSSLAHHDVDTQLAEVQVSQTNSLYCSDLGEVTILDTHDVLIDEPKSQVTMAPLDEKAGRDALDGEADRDGMEAQADRDGMEA
ncbi:hypothetical protein PINS_up006488 [Pythium insidiosum]|nr:hypothetical protein PINS_up006488 [Pythium insidiosum]